MILLFTSPSCTSCRKARLWLNARHIAYQERNVVADPLQPEELKRIMAMTEEGTAEIISTRSKTFMELNLDLESLTTNQLIALVVAHPGLLRRPIIMDEKRLQVGFNEDEMRRFLPREVRAVELQQAQLLAGF
ncbi:transcriptional regulator Spx [Lacticaseibacillus parakribbianus]|uniref:transcriptional regulator Spx n=1 Tax=Lacticaseibacillus parakribbianus TaxID=2970927 RepID=UPI0021CB387B|nr:transcriptional regulator Spx [Lacticaseibacillus parakribbianus]